jgi:hypothetical protein
MEERVRCYSFNLSRTPHETKSITKSKVYSLMCCWLYIVLQLLFFHLFIKFPILPTNPHFARVVGFGPRISNKYGSVTALKQWPNQTYTSSKAGLQIKSQTRHWSEIILEIRHQFLTSILLSNWILTNQQTLIWNLGSDAYFDYTSCYFKVETFHKEFVPSTSIFITYWRPAPASQGWNADIRVFL